MMSPGIPVRVMMDGEQGAGGAWTADAKSGDSLRAADAMIGFESGGRRLTTRLIAGEYIKYCLEVPRGFRQPR